MTTNIGKKVREFYNKTPFPDYELDNFNSKQDLSLAAYPFAKILDRSIPQKASIIDVGTGTGQLPAFLSLRRKCVWGVDFSDNSLNKARELKEKLCLHSLHLKKVDILNPKEIKSIGKKFDYVLCFGVLHHTGNAYEGFQNILKLLKPEGHIAVGLYNKLGRIPLKMRRLLVKSLFKNNKKVKKWFIEMQIGKVRDKKRIKGWWKDQYLHPYESTHTIGEVLNWFRKNNIQYYQTVPSTAVSNQIDLEIAGVWNNTSMPIPNLPRRIYKQLCWVWSTHREGGYWITFGRHKQK